MQNFSSKKTLKVGGIPFTEPGPKAQVKEKCSIRRRKAFSGWRRRGRRAMVLEVYITWCFILKHEKSWNTSWSAFCNTHEIHKSSPVFKSRLVLTCLWSGEGEGWRVSHWLSAYCASDRKVFYIQLSLLTMLYGRHPHRTHSKIKLVPNNVK